MNNRLSFDKGKILRETKTYGLILLNQWAQTYKLGFSSNSNNPKLLPDFISVLSSRFQIFSRLKKSFGDLEQSGHLRCVFTSLSSEDRVIVRGLRPSMDPNDLGLRVTGGGVYGGVEILVRVVSIDY